MWTSAGVGDDILMLVSIKMKRIWTKIFGSKRSSPTEVKDEKSILYIWEDDYLMVELVSVKNLKFLMTELQRIEDFSQNNYDGQGFTDITPIAKKPFELASEKILTDVIQTILVENGIQKVTKINMQDVGILKKEDMPIAYGNFNYAVILEEKDGILTNLWFTGKIQLNSEEKKIKKSLNQIQATFNLLGVDWFQCKVYDFSIENAIDDFLKDSI